MVASLNDPVTMLAAIRAGDPKFRKLRASASIPPLALAAALRDSSNTTELIMSGLSYSRAELCALLEALSLNQRLQVLDLSEMRLDEDTLMDVVDLVAHSRTIARVDLSSNDVTPDVASALGAALRDHVSMRTLILRDVDLRDDGLDGLLSALGPDGCTLHKLAIPHNAITDVGARALAAFTRKSMELTAVNVAGNTIPSDVADIIATSCKRNVARIGFDPASRPSSVAASRQGPRGGRLIDPVVALVSKLLPETSLLLACEEGGALPNLTLLAVCEHAYH
jgi:hypothetical protein